MGILALVVGVILVAHGVHVKHYDNGGGAILIGLGWIACEWIPVTRTRARWLAVMVVMFAGVLIEKGLKSAGVLR